MEYIQTVLLQIEASRLEQASQAGGLLPELDEHRSFLKQQPGFRDLRITRSINNEGSVLVVIESRWADDESLVRYETNEPNVAAIVNKHYDVVIRDTVQVLDMEALRSEASWAPMEAAAQARARVTLPLLVPLGVLAFALLVIYGLSRVYLELSKSEATVLAAGIAIGILLIAFYLALNPRVPGWQIGGILVIAAAALTGGAIWALMQEDTGEAASSGPSVTASPAASPSSPAPGGGLSVSMGDNFFEYQGQKSPTISVGAGQQVTINLTNSGAATHNMHVDGTDNKYAVTFCGPGQEETACSDPNIISGGATATITFKIDKAGTYNFRCDFHLQEMVGKIEVK
jgi:plastocyanin/heme-degrading monooxygenase HmoA